MFLNLRCRAVVLIVAVAYIIGIVVQLQFNCQPPFDSRFCLAHKLESKFRRYQEGVFRHAENCTIASEMGDSNVQYLKISCLVDDPASSWRSRLQPGDHFRSVFSRQRIPKPLMSKWTLRVPRDAVKRAGDSANLLD